jgi:hypothetical protein
MTAAVSPLSETVARELTEQRAESPQAKLATLTRLWQEAEETARLANLLGRAPYAAAVLAAAGIATAVLSSPKGPAQSIAWLVLMMAAIAAIARAYWHTIRAPFERAPLRAFAQDLDAIMLYAGFTWGAGSLLVLPEGTSLATLTLFGAGLPTAMLAILKAYRPSLLFFAPVAGLTGLSALVGSHPGGTVLAGALLSVSAGLALAILAIERRGQARIPSLPLT